jgi:hypothetical protein
MRKIIVSVLISAAILSACRKEYQSSDNGWNAITFTEVESSDFESYKDLPYLNLTFPERVKRGIMEFREGLFTLEGFSYVFVGHNWGDREIHLHLFRNGSKYYEKSIQPQADAAGNSPLALRNFSFGIVLEPGEYSFAIDLKDERGLTRLNSHLLHNTKGRMVVL